jgi:hypothetical protein
MNPMLVAFLLIFAALLWIAKLLERVEYRLTQIREYLKLAEGYLHRISDRS